MKMVTPAKRTQIKHLQFYKSDKYGDNKQAPRSFIINEVQVQDLASFDLDDLEKNNAVISTILSGDEYTITGPRFVVEEDGNKLNVVYKRGLFYAFTSTFERLYMFNDVIKEYRNNIKIIRDDLNDIINNGNSKDDIEEALNDYINDSETLSSFIDNLNQMASGVRLPLTHDMKTFTPYNTRKKIIYSVLIIDSNGLRDEIYEHEWDVKIRQNAINELIADGYDMELETKYDKEDYFNRVCRNNVRKFLNDEREFRFKHQ